MIKVLRHLAAAYTGRDALPKPCLQSVGWPQQLVTAAEAAGMKAPAALLDQQLAGPVPQVGLLYSLIWLLQSATAD